LYGSGPLLFSLTDLFVFHERLHWRPTDSTHHHNGLQR
jgi:hypothetical protein